VKEILHLLEEEVVACTYLCVMFYMLLYFNMPLCCMYLANFIGHNCFRYALNLIIRVEMYDSSD